MEDFYGKGEPVELLGLVPDVLCCCADDSEIAFYVALDLEGA